MEPVLTQEELEAIYEAMRAETAAEPDVEEISFADGRIFTARATAEWNEVAKTLAPGFEIALANALGRRIRIDIDDAFAVEDPAGADDETPVEERPVVALLSFKNTKMLLGLGRPMAAQYIDRRTGAAADAGETDRLERDLTALERLLLRDLIDKLACALVKAAPRLGPARAELPEAAALVETRADGGQWIEVGFTERGEAGGRIWLQGSAAVFLPRPEAPGRAIVDNLKDAAVEVRVELGRCRMRVSELWSLTPGTFVPLGATVGDPVRILVGGVPKLVGEPLVSRGNIAVRVLGRVGKGIGR
ncbi:MAG: FliM/FliN family flagellar motor switch protein [Deltaproteobacteria bacterium]|nr:FliM/FliN family flagellar motor switch protein [Deltaproteobacteria bacterium]